jgi:outer membrane receptor for ferric coprogen and ferric-rhodotorulic acid
LPNAPRYTANFWINFDPTNKLKGLSLGAGCFYKSSFFSFFDNNPDLKIPSSYTIDLAIGYTYKVYHAQLNITNLTNQVNYLNPWTFNLFDVQPLRRVVLTLNWTFGEKGE